MQIVSHRGNVVKKILRDREGRLIHATFYVYEIAGRIKGRLLEFNYVNEISGKVVSLFTNQKAKINKKINFLKVLSYTYFTKDILAFSGSKPRAPAY